MKLTGRTGVIVLGTIAAVLFGTWLIFPLTRPILPGSDHVLNQKSAQLRQIVLACRSFAADWEGEYSSEYLGDSPNSLDFLYPDYIDDEDFLIAENEDGEKRPLIFYKDAFGKTETNRIFVEYPFLIRGKRLVGYTNGHVVLIRE